MLYCCWTVLSKCWGLLPVHLCRPADCMCHLISFCRALLPSHSVQEAYHWISVYVMPWLRVGCVDVLGVWDFYMDFIAFVWICQCHMYCIYDTVMTEENVLSYWFSNQVAPSEKVCTNYQIVPLIHKEVSNNRGNECKCIRNYTVCLAVICCFFGNYPSE